MESTEVPAWTRPAKTKYRALRAVPWVSGAAVVCVSLVTGMALADEGSTHVVTMPQPIVVNTPAPAIQPVSVTLATPEPVEKPAQPMRLAVPILEADCFGLIGADSPKPCDWDTGFPAISGDGRRVAELVIEGPMGPIDASVVIYDVATSKQVRKLTISRSEDFDFEKQTEAAARAKVVQRTAAAQRELNAGKFRSLIPLGVHGARPMEKDEPADVTGDEQGVHAEWTNATMRLIDPTTRVELWRHAFSAPGPTYDKPATEDDLCRGWELAQITGWWDPQARVVVGQLMHHNGASCMCGETMVTQTFKL